MFIEGNGIIKDKEKVNLYKNKAYGSAEKTGDVSSLQGFSGIISASLAEVFAFRRKKSM